MDEIVFSEVLLSSLQYAYTTVYSDSEHPRPDLRFKDGLFRAGEASGKVGNYCFLGL